MRHINKVLMLNTLNVHCTAYRFTNTYLYKVIRWCCRWLWTKIKYIVVFTTQGMQYTSQIKLTAVCTCIAIVKSDYKFLRTLRKFALLIKSPPELNKIACICTKKTRIARWKILLY